MLLKWMTRSFSATESWNETLRTIFSTFLRMANLGDTLFTSSLRDILVLKSIVMTWVGPVLRSPSAYSHDYVTERSHEISGKDVETGLQTWRLTKPWGKIPLQVKMEKVIASTRLKTVLNRGQLLLLLARWVFKIFSRICCIATKLIKLKSADVHEITYIWAGTRQAFFSFQSSLEWNLNYL